MSARDDDHAAIMAEDEAGGVQYWRETAEEAMTECHSLQDRVAQLELDRAALDTALSSRARQLHDTQLEMHGLRARIADLEATFARVHAIAKEYGFKATADVVHDGAVMMLVCAHEALPNLNARIASLEADAPAHVMRELKAAQEQITAVEREYEGYSGMALNRAVEYEAALKKARARVVELEAERRAAFKALIDNADETRRDMGLPAHESDLDAYVAGRFGTLPELLEMGFGANRAAWRDARAVIAELEHQLSCSRDRTAVLASRLEARDKHCEELEDALRSLASYVGNGGYNAPEVNAAEFEGKVRDGIDTIASVETQRRETAETRAADLEAVVARVRAKCAAWAEEAKRTSNLLPRDRTERLEGYAEAQDDCADDVLAVLPKEPRI